MSNMGYCRFENTVNDIDDCIESLEENDWHIEDMVKNASSKNEAQAIKAFVRRCRDVAADSELCGFLDMIYDT